MLVLTTERLRLRWFEPADAPHVLAQLLEPSWIANIRDPGVHDLAAAQRWMEEKLFAGYWSAGLGLWAVERASDGVLLGMCGLLQRDYLPAPDIGYAFLPRFWGQGYAREAAAGCLLYAQEVLGQSRLYATTAPENLASQKLLLGLGYRYQEDLALDGYAGVSKLFVWGGCGPERSEETRIKDRLMRFYRVFNNRAGRLPNVSALPFWLMPRAMINRSEKDGLQRVDLRDFMRQRYELLGPGGRLQDYEETVSTKRLEMHGRIAHVWLRYQQQGRLDGRRFSAQGVKSLQLIKLAEGWKIAALASEALV